MASQATRRRSYSNHYDADEEKQAGPQPNNGLNSTATADVPPNLASYDQEHAQSMSEDVDAHPFAGRLGGGQRFTVTGSLAKSPSRQADAFRDVPWRALIDPKPFLAFRLWRLALIEGVGTSLQVFLSGLLGHALVKTVTETSVGPVFPVALASIAQIFLISSFIYCAGPITGAHFNPLITFATFTARLSTLPRTILYVAFQCAGAVVGAYMVRAGLGLPADEVGPFPGCYTDSSLVTSGDAFAIEFFTCFNQLFLAFGLGLDPRNSSSFGPALAPLLIGITSALGIFCTSAIRPGYLGASQNPARCLGLMAASQDFTYHWVHWVGALAAAILNGFLYWAVPPYKKDEPNALRPQDLRRS